MDLVVLEMATNKYSTANIGIVANLQTFIQNVNKLFIIIIIECSKIWAKC